MFNLVTAKTKHWVFPLNKGTENQSELSFLSGFCHVLSDCEAWILSIMAVFLYKCLLQVITRWLCSKSLQLSVDRFFWGRDNCSFLQRKLSHRHTMPKPLASLSKPCVQSRGRILFETFGLEKLVWKWTQFFLWWNVHLVQDFLHRIIILFWRFHFGKLKILKDSSSMVTIFIELPFFPVSVVKFSFMHVTIRSFRMNTHLNE